MQRGSKRKERLKKIRNWLDALSSQLLTHPKSQARRILRPLLKILMRKTDIFIFTREEQSFKPRGRMDLDLSRRLSMRSKKKSALSFPNLQRLRISLSWEELLISHLEWILDGHLLEKIPFLIRIQSQLIKRISQNLVCKLLLLNL